MGRLLERDDSVLIVVDVQPAFFGAAAGQVAESGDVLARIAWLVQVAAALDVPIVVTEEEPVRNGSTDRRVTEALPPGTPVFTKPAFGLADVPDIVRAIDTIGRRTAVLVGAETDVCVAHSALGLLDRGLRVAVVSDATYSPGLMQEHGLRRIAQAGGVTTHAKGVYYEWLRTVDAATAFTSEHPDLREPPGFSL